MVEFFKRDSCRLCDNSNLELVMHVASTPVGDDFISSNRLDKIQNKYPLDLYFCQDCGLLQVAGAINPEIIYGDYLYETSISLGLSEHFQRYSEDLLRRLSPNKGTLVVDIGSNDGSLLRCFQDNGMRVLGVEPAHNIAKMATESGVETIPNFFHAELSREIKAKHGPAAIITANNVLANIDNLVDMIEGIRELLSPDGVFVFETGYMVDLIQNTVLDNVYHEHLCYFSVKPLIKHFNNHGFELIEVERIPTKGGSIRGTVQFAGGPRTVFPSVHGLMTFETELGFDRMAPFKAFVSRVEIIKQQLTKVLNGLKEQGKIIAGYGASVGVTTLLHYFGIGDIINALYDDNQIKHNLYSPGHHIHVLSSEAIYEQNPDYIVLFAWRYAKPIINKHQAYLDRGGQFILPFPIVEIVGGNNVVQV